MSNFRVSDQSRYVGAVSNYNRLLSKQIDLQQQISSGKMLTKASQDPLAAGLAQGYQVNADRLDQDLKNIDQANSFSQQTYTAIDGAIQSLQRARELAVTAGDGTLSDSNRSAMSAEANTIISTLMNMGSQKYGSQFLFSGTQTDVPAFAAVTDASGTITAVTYQGNSEDIATEYTPGQNLNYNLLGSNENGGTTGVLRDVNAGIDVFQTLIDFRDNLINGNTAGLSTSLQSISNALDHVTTVTAIAGGTQAQLASATTLHQDQQDLLSATLSKLQDTDIAAAATELSATQTAYQASLAIGAKVGSISLLDYLR